MFKIEKPGIFLDVADADYRSDPCPTPSLTQSLAKILLEKSPLHAWYAHPRLNPDYRHNDDRKFDVGNIAHKLLIGRGKEIVVLDGFDDWRTKDAKARRDEAAAEGKIAVLGKHFALADRMVKAAREQLYLRRLATAFTEGNGEVVLAWQENGLWFRSMVDWIVGAGLVYDYKTTGMSCAPHAIGRMMADAGWDVQAAMIERGLDVLDPDNAGRRCFRFVAQEDEPPYAITACELSESVMTMGRKKLTMAISMWARCVQENRWPGYVTALVYPEYPGWAESQWLNREIADAAQERVSVRGEKMLTNMAGG
ncbi:MAG: PD-(D/E)XK nuclease-like domain-containing protein [Sulfuricaulis sp.]|nr:PD-(D/E)XK nuclease-like domain-containing protein [Sulfuricaulis sp.]